MFKNLMISFLLLLVSCVVKADFIGIFGGAGYWKGDIGGDVITDVSIGDELGVSGDGGNYFYVALEHPIPLVPNVKIARTNIEDSGSGIVGTTFTFEGATFSTGQSVSTKVDLTYTDFTLYYELVDVGFDLDLGLTARQFVGELQVDAVKEDANGIVPMLYASTKIGLPLSGLYVGAEVNGTSFSGDSLIDYAVKVGWETENFILPEVGVEAGFRRLSIDSDDNVDLDLEVDGVFINLTAHF